MKVFCAIIAAVAALCFCLPSGRPAEAESIYVYGRADVTNAYLCSEPDSSTALFAIPYTYCVRIISDYGMWYYVRYAEDSGSYSAVYGYVLQNLLTVTSDEPAAEWLCYIVTVTFSQGTSGSLPTLSDITATGAFYGNYYSGLSGYAYVLCQGSFGYIAGAIEDYELVEIAVADSSAEEAEEGGSGKVVAAVVLGVIAFAALLLIVLSGRKKT